MIKTNWLFRKNDEKKEPLVFESVKIQTLHTKRDKKIFFFCKFEFIMKRIGFSEKTDEKQKELVIVESVKS